MIIDLKKKIKINMGLHTNKYDKNKKVVSI
jgi:hypothetical protein